MNTRTTNNLRMLRTCGTLALIALGLYGCGTGAPTEPNPTTTTATVSNYSGPPPATADVQSFKLNVWDNLVPNNRCGTCHDSSQAPRFVRSDDINLAYNEANTIVDLNDPAQSRLVSKVRGGHNCWLTSNDACGDIIQSYIEAWAGDTVGAGAATVQLVAPLLRDPGDSKNWPADQSQTMFATTVHPLLELYCAECHTDSAAVPQNPYFASSDVDVAYDQAKAKIDLDTPANSRMVIRLGVESHNCWTDCATSANAMLDAITTLTGAISPTQIDAALVTSKAMNLANDGIIASSGGRFETNVIASWEFKTGSGTTAFDTSGVEPSLNMTLSGAFEWVGGWGIKLSGGKAQGSTTASKKLFDLITATNEYSIEAWVVPGNVVQDGPARIVSYSGGTMARNFMLGQTQYDYDTFNRTDQNNDPAGEPQFSTDSADEDLQATLQHVVLTYDPNNGRRIYVNGVFTDDIDPASPGLLNPWDDTFAMVVGSEVDNNNTWAGVVRMLAVHNRALTEEQIVQNYDVGVGEKFFVLFNVTDHVGIPDAYVVFEVGQFDSYSYLFNTPFFVILDGSAQPGDIPMQGIRIGLNGREVPVSQAYQNLDITINNAAYAVEGVQRISPLGTVVPLEKGPADDEFFLTFELLGSAQNVVVEADPPAPAIPPDVPRGNTLGVRDFAEINATMSKVTGIPTTDAGVDATYNRVYQALPVNTAVAGFLSSQQMGVTQLAIAYCDALVDDVNLRQAYFPGLNFGAVPTTDLADPSLLTTPLVINMMGTGLTSQPDITVELDALIGRLSVGGASTSGVVKGTCAAALGSATMLIQ